MAKQEKKPCLELLGGDIVGVTDEDALVLGEELVGLLEIGLFPRLSIPFDHFENRRAADTLFKIQRQGSDSV